MTREVTKYHAHCPYSSEGCISGDDPSNCVHCYECPECGASELAGEEHDAACSCHEDEDEEEAQD